MPVSSRFCAFACPLAFVALLAALPAAAQKLPQIAPLPPPLPTPVDKPYVGPVEATVDLTDNLRRVASIHEVIPVPPKATEITLLYPQWVPGGHSPRGAISKLGGIFVKENGQPVEWVRDRVEVYAFHVPIVNGAKTVELDFQYLSPLKPQEGRIQISDEIADVAWIDDLMYPAGYFTRDIPFNLSVKLPEGWKYATALDTDSVNGSVVKFKTTDLEKLIDSPMYAGSHYKQWDLSTGPENTVRLNVFADAESDLAMTPEELQLHKNLTEQAQKLYHSHHYDHYDFLLLLSNKVGGVGLEHHQSSEDGHPTDYFTNWTGGVGGRDLLGHEYTHSWDGKFRRPFDLWTPNYNWPMQDDLLWVYEGMTQYWGNVLTARSGMRSAADTRDILAATAAGFEANRGRDWRPMVDTTNQPIISNRSPVSWVSWQRPEDYYTEGMLIWLDADTKIRELSGDKKSLDDFAQLFLGEYNGSYKDDVYSFDDVVAALNKVQPYDWAGFLHERVYRLHPQVPEDGFTRGGYKLVYNDTISPWQKAAVGRGAGGFSCTSLGLSVAGDGSLAQVYWESPAWKAGVTPDMVLQAVNGRAFSPEVMREELIKGEVGGEKASEPLKLLLKRGDAFVTVEVDYHGGLRVPHLERVAGTPDRLDAILAPAGGPSVVQ